MRRANPLRIGKVLHDMVGIIVQRRAPVADRGRPDEELRPCGGGVTERQFRLGRRLPIACRRVDRSHEVGNLEDWIDRWTAGREGEVAEAAVAQQDRDLVGDVAYAGVRGVQAPLSVYEEPAVEWQAGLAAGGVQTQLQRQFEPRCVALVAVGQDEGRDASGVGMCGVVGVLLVVDMDLNLVRDALHQACHRAAAGLLQERRARHEGERITRRGEDGAPRARIGDAVDRRFVEQRQPPGELVGGRPRRRSAGCWRHGSRYWSASVNATARSDRNGNRRRGARRAG